MGQKMNRKQVKAFLKVLSADKSRTISSAYVDEYKDKTVLVGTDGYILGAVYLDDGAKALVGKMVRRDALERWYNLADSKSNLDSVELAKMIIEKENAHGNASIGEYPAWKTIIPTTKDDDFAMAMSLDASLMKTIQDLDGGKYLKLEFFEKNTPVIAKSENGTYIICPVKS